MGTHRVNALPPCLYHLSLPFAAADFVDVSGSVLIFATQSFFSRPNTMRELLRAYVKSKPLIVLMETDEARGAIPGEELLHRLSTAEHMYKEWGLHRDLAEWQCTQPSAGELVQALFSRQTIEVR